MSYISHNQYTSMLKKLTASSAKGKLLKESIEDARALEVELRKFFEEHYVPEAEVLKQLRYSSNPDGSVTVMRKDYGELDTDELEMEYDVEEEVEYYDMSPGPEDGESVPMYQYIVKKKSSPGVSEKLDPVGKEDSDIDNDGDTDETDEYLLKRRKAVSRSISKGRMMKEGVPKGAVESLIMSWVIPYAWMSATEEEKAQLKQDIDRARNPQGGESGVEYLKMNVLIPHIMHKSTVSKQEKDELVKDIVAAEKQEKEMQPEGLKPAPLQATGQTVVTNEDQAPYGFGVLSPDERKQLKEYIESIKTIKKEIAKLTAKAGKKFTEGGDRTGLTMPVSEKKHPKMPDEK